MSFIKISMSSLILFSLLFTEVIAEEPKLVGMFRFGVGHHQNDFLIPDDCVGGDERCKQRLIKQNYQLTKNFIVDSFIYLVGDLNPDIEDTQLYQKGELLERFNKRESLYADFSLESCGLESYCHLGLSCGRGDIGYDDFCLDMKLSERTDFMGNEVISGVGGIIKVLQPRLELQTSTHTIHLEYGCEPLIFDCQKIKYSGRSKKSGNSISLEGAPYFGYGKNPGEGPRMLGFYFSNESIEYYVSLAGVLKVYDTKSNENFLEQKGTWHKAP
jgi:hypothetical protein